MLIAIWLPLQLKHDDCYDTFCASVVKMAYLAVDAYSIAHLLSSLNRQFGYDNLLETFLDLVVLGMKKGKQQLAIARYCAMSIML